MAVTFGSANSNPALFTGPALSAFNTLAGGEDRAQQALALANALSPKLQEFDPYIAAMKYFTGMTAAASKPGATVFGSAAQAFASPVAYLQEVNQFNDKIAASAPQTAITLAGALKPDKTSAGSLKSDFYGIQKKNDDGTLTDVVPTPLTPSELQALKADPTIIITPIKTDGSSSKALSPLGKLIADFDGGNGDMSQTQFNSMFSKLIGEPSSTDMESFTLSEDRNIGGINYKAGQTTFLTPSEAFDNRNFLSQPTDNSIKTVGSGTQALLMAEADAQAFVRSQGIEESNENFAQYVSMLTAPTDDLIGKPLVRGDSFTKIVPLQIGSKVSALQFSPITGQTPDFVGFRKKRLEVLAKNKDTHLDNIGQSIPRIETAMNTLLSGQVETGLITEFTLPVKRFLAQAFGIDAAVITSLDDLQAISFYLAPKMRPVGSGSTSDMEFKAYQQAILDLGKTTEANYISLYAMKQMMKKGIELKFLEEELLQDFRITSTSDLNARLRSVDTGIFEKYTGDSESQEDFDAWYNSLPNGAVIVNNGLPVFGDSPYFIKGWRGDQG